MQPITSDIPPITKYITGRLQPTQINPTQRRIIITGGPSAGKTTILQALSAKNYTTIAEAATDIIKEDQIKGIVYPWYQPNFDARILKLQKERQQEALNRKVNFVFFDRSPIDPLSYVLRIYPKPPDNIFIHTVEELLKDGYYDPIVFLVEEHGFFEKNDIRCENPELAKIIENQLEKNYTDLGFRVMRVPSKTTVEERVKFIIEKVLIINNEVKVT